MGHIYKLDFAGGKSYIGITTPLYNAWRKYGDPTLTVLAVVEDSDLAQAEIRAIKAFNTLVPNGYSTLEGGQVSPMNNEESRGKVAAAQKAVWSNQEYRDKVLSARTGKKRSDESRKRMSESKKRYYEQLRKEQA